MGACQAFVSDARTWPKVKVGRRGRPLGARVPVEGNKLGALRKIELVPVALVPDVPETVGRFPVNRLLEAQQKLQPAPAPKRNKFAPVEKGRVGLGTLTETCSEDYSSPGNARDRPLARGEIALVSVPRAAPGHPVRNLPGETNEGGDAHDLRPVRIVTELSGIPTVNELLRRDAKQSPSLYVEETEPLFSVNDFDSRGMGRCHHALHRRGRTTRRTLRGVSHASPNRVKPSACRTGRVQSPDAEPKVSIRGCASTDTHAAECLQMPSARRSQADSITACAGHSLVNNWCRRGDSNPHGVAPNGF